MTDILLDDEIILKNRIILRETYLKRLTSRYLELISKFNTLTRSEMAQHIKEILNEIDLIEISLIKAENLSQLRDFDMDYQKTLSQNLVQKVDSVKKEVQEGIIKLKGALEEKEYKIECEETSKIINSFRTREELGREISELQEEIQQIDNNEKVITNKLSSKKKKLSLLIKLINDLKSNSEEESLNNYDEMVVD